MLEKTLISEIKGSVDLLWHYTGHSFFAQSKLKINPTKAMLAWKTKIFFLPKKDVNFLVFGGKL